MEEKTLKKAYRNAWIIAVLGVAYIALFYFLARAVNEPERAAEWDMGGKPFVPASSVYAEDYYLPADPNYQPE